MLLERPQFREAFHGAVRDDALDNEADKKLLVFVSTAEADSVCAVRILSVRRSHQQGTIPVIGNSFLSCRTAESWAWRSFVSVAGKCVSGLRLDGIITERIFNAPVTCQNCGAD